MTFEHWIWNSFWHISTVGICEIMSMVREVSLIPSFFFPHTSKHIPVKLQSQTLNHWIIVKCEHQILNSFSHIPTFGIWRIMFVKRETSLAWRQWNWGSNPFSFSLMLWNSSRTTKGKTWRILGNHYRCYYHCRTTHMSPLRGKYWVTHALGLEWACIWIPRG